MKKIYLLTLLSLFTSQHIQAQTENLQWKLSGRFHFDGVGYVNSPDTLSSELDIVDARLGGRITMGDWFLKIDVSYASNKVSLKDVFLQYTKNNNFFRAGHQTVFAGIDQSNGSNNLLFNASPNIGRILDNGRRLGFTYTRSLTHYYLTTGMFMGNDIHVKSSVKQGYTAVLRTVWRPINEKHNLFHLGVSGLYRVPDELKGTDFKNITLSNRGVIKTKGPILHFLSINDAKNQTMCVGEVFGFKDKWMAVGEFYWTQINRRNAAYKAHGGYVQGGYLLRGNRYGYNQVDALPVLPTDDKSLLLIARYNQSNMNDEKSGLYAGNQKDFSIGLAYFYNKYLSARLNYSYVKLDEHSTIGKEELHVIQGRLQFKF